MQSAQNIPPHLNGQFTAMIEEMRVKDQVKMYSQIIESCTKECVNTFHSKSLTSAEETCIDNCAKKFLKMTQRMGMRFAEHQQTQQAQQQGLNQ